MSDEWIAADPDFDDLARRLAESAREIEVPRERIDSVRAEYIEAIDASGARHKRRSRRALVAVAATLLLSAFAGTAYASSSARPGSALWSLRTAGWNLKLAFTSEEEHPDELAEQAEVAAELADEAASRCDSHGAETARKEAISRVQRARESLKESRGGNSGNAQEVLAGVEAKLAQLPPPGGPVCDESGTRVGGSGVRSAGDRPGSGQGAGGPPADRGASGSPGGGTARGGEDSDPSERGGNPDPGRAGQEVPKGPPTEKGPPPEKEKA